MTSQVAATPSDLTLSTLLNQIRASGARLTSHNVKFEMLWNKLGQLNVSTVDDTNHARDRYSPAWCVHFDTRQRSPSARRMPPESQACPLTAPPRHTNQRHPNGCYRFCNSYHCGRCPALNVACLWCGCTGHYRSVCLQGCRATTRPRE